MIAARTGQLPIFVVWELDLSGSLFGYLFGSF